MYAQSPCTLINEFVHRLFCETKIHRSVIPQQDFFGKRFLPGSRRPGKLKKKPKWQYLSGGVTHNKLAQLHVN